MSDTKAFTKAVRTEDEPVYLNENRFGEPKEMFKLVARLMGDEGRAAAHVADFGCATGELLYYLGQVFPDYRLTGLDPSEAMLARGREMLPGVTLLKGSVLDAPLCASLKADVVTCIGVLTIIDDIEAALTNLVSALNPGGTLYVFNAINPYPIDVMVRFRRSESDGEWELGRNLHSKVTMERALEAAAPGIAMTWHPFHLPMDIAERDDPMRTWTIQTERNPRQLINGACQLVHLECLQARKPA